MKQILHSLSIVMLISFSCFGQHISRNISSHHSDNHHDHDHNGNHSTVKHKISFNSGTVEIVDIGELQVKTTTGSEVIIESIVEHDGDNDRVRGLKVLNSAGLEDNTNMGISTKIENNVLMITQINANCDCHDVTVYIPNGVKVSITNQSMHAEDISISDIPNEIMISTLYQDVYLKNVSGPMAIKSVYGEIEADLTNVSQHGSITLNAVYDLIDVSLPANTKADLSLSAPYGEIYSDLSVEITKTNGMKNLSGTKIKGTINGGGVLISLKASYENIYLRKK